MEQFVTLVRGLVRPIISIMFAAAMIQALIEKVELPSWFIGIAGGCIGWWFIDRSVQHIRNGGAE